MRSGEDQRSKVWAKSLGTKLGTAQDLIT